MARAALVLVSGKYLDKHRHRQNEAAALARFGHTTDYLALEKKDAPIFSTARKAAQKAFGMANLKPRDMNGVEVHDCFSSHGNRAPTKFSAWRRTAKAPSWRRVARRRLPQVRNEKVRGKFDFEIPVNAGGGLIGDGHPVGATGVRQVFEAYQQLTDQAGARQIEGAKRYLTFNMGGSLTTSVAMIWGRD